MATVMLSCSWFGALQSGSMLVIRATYKRKGHIAEHKTGLQASPAYPASVL